MAPKKDTPPVKISAVNGKPIAELKPFRRFLFRSLAFPFFITAFLIGCAGTFVLSDLEHKKFAITTSQFGDLWIKLVNFNPMFNALFVIGGGFGTLYTYLVVTEDIQAREIRLAAEAAAAGDGKKEAKKDK